MLLAIFISTLIVVVSVLIHYEVLNFLSQRLMQFRERHRSLVLIGVLGSMLAHILEVIVFGTGIYGMLQIDGMGTLQGSFNGSFLDCVYFSFTNYTTLGYGDIYPFGYIRFLIGLESLTGLVLITWSASFMFIEMQRFWKR
ncbi:MAG: ion channel [Cellvibrionaceae bacterium]